MSKTDKTSPGHNKVENDIGWEKFLTPKKALFFVVFILSLNSLALLLGSNNRGTFGDMFGVSNALFSGLAFAGVIWAIILQKEELRLQRQEISETREEIKGQKEALEAQHAQLEAQNKTMVLQQFEANLFQMLSLYNEIVKGIFFMNRSGKSAFRNLINEFIKFWQEQENDCAENQGKLPPIGNDAIKTWVPCFYEKKRLYIDNYFRHLYDLYKFIDDSNLIDEEKKMFYGNIVRSQFRGSELGIIFYYSLTDRGKKFKNFIEKYAVFELLIDEALIPKAALGHRQLYEPSAYGKPS